MSLTFIFFRRDRDFGFFRTGDAVQYMVCRLRSHWHFSPIITFHLSANGVTVLVRLLYFMILSDPEATFCAIRSGIFLRQAVNTVLQLRFDLTDNHRPITGIG